MASVPNFESLLARADEVTLRQLVGREELGLLELLDPSLIRAAVLRDLVRDLYTPIELLRNSSTRAELLLLLRSDEARALCVELSSGTTIQSDNDAYRFLSDLKVRRGSIGEIKLLRALAVDPEPTSVNGQAVSPSGSASAIAQYGLFDHQRDAVARANDALAKEPRRVLLHMPTGSGKTRAAMNLIAEHLRTHDPAVVIWLAYSEELCEQAVTEFLTAWSHLGNRHVSVQRHWGRFNLDLDTLNDGLLVAGLGKTHNILMSSIHRFASLGDRVSMVIIDEAHMATAKTYSETLDGLAVKRPATGLLGLTATPGRTWADIDADEELADFFGRKKVTLRVEGYGNPVDYLVDQGYLSKATFSSLLHSGGFDPSRSDLYQIEQSLDIPARFLERLAVDTQRNLVITNALEEVAKRHNRILFFAATVRHARLIATVLRARGHQSSVVTGETASYERSRILARFQTPSDNPQILCNFGVLTTGFDAPSVSAAVIARPTKSLVLFSQMVGRALRGPQMGGTEECEIITVVDQNLPGFGGVAESFMNWQDIWEEA